MSYTFPQMMSELDPNMTWPQLHVDIAHGSWYGTFGTHLDWGLNPWFRTWIKGLITSKLQDVLETNREPSFYFNPLVADAVSHVIYPAPTYVATYVS